MKKILVYIAVSADGYIADTAGGVQWLTGDGSCPDNPGTYPHFVEQIGTVVMGRRTYDRITTELSPGKWPYEGKKCYVFTHRLGLGDGKATFTALPVKEFLEHMKETEGADLWLCGGADLINQALDSGCVDELYLCIIPKLLGRGIRLFNEKDTTLSLRLIDIKQYNGIAELHYKIKN